MAQEISLAESLIEDEIGCGPFQVTIAILLYVFAKMTSVINLVFMSFGNYNPGWRCLDNNTLGFNDTPITVVVNASQEYQRDLSCAAFEACEQVEFNPESSTIVTEWNLVCDRAWIGSLIITIQMAGSIVGQLFFGQIIDNLGRKKTFYGALFATGVLAGISVFSPSWEVFAGFRFFSGFFTSGSGSLNYVYPCEFFPKKWRGPLSGIPGWGAGGILFAVTCMLLKNWRHVLLVTSAYCLLTFLPVFWVPESLRWLEAKNKHKEFRKVVERMAKVNKKTLTGLGEAGCSLQQSITSKEESTKYYTYLDLFRPGYRLLSVLIPIVASLTTLNFVAVSFGIKALSGNFYINMSLFYLITFLCAPLPLYAPNLLGRKKGSIIFQFSTALCFLTAAILEKFTNGEVRIVGTLVLVLVAQACLDTAICLRQTHISEIYPTVVRGLAASWVHLAAAVCGLFAPFIIARDAASVYVWYLVMGSMGLVACFLTLRLPETKGKPLQETFGQTLETETVTENTTQSVA